MSVLSYSRRKHLKSTTFGLPKERKYPMPDKSHAVNAKARATQMANKGKLSSEQKKKIDAKANKILHEGKSMKHKDSKKASHAESKKAHTKHMKHAAIHHAIAKKHVEIAKLHKKVK